MTHSIPARAWMYRLTEAALEYNNWDYMLFAKGSYNPFIDLDDATVVGQIMVQGGDAKIIQLPLGFKCQRIDEESDRGEFKALFIAHKHTVKSKDPLGHRLMAFLRWMNYLLEFVNINEEWDYLLLVRKPEKWLGSKKTRKDIKGASFNGQIILREANWEPIKISCYSPIAAADQKIALFAFITESREPKGQSGEQ